MSGGQLCGGIIILMVAACAAQNGRNELPESPVAVAGEELRFVGDAVGAPAGCDLPAVVDHLSRFLMALNQGEIQIAERFFTDGTTTRFQWFSFTDRGPGSPMHFETFTPDSLDDFFAARHAAGDRFKLRGAKLIGYVAERGTVGFSPVLFDYIIDRDKSIVFHYGFGKGEYHCDTGRFMGMSLGVQADHEQWAELWAGLKARNGR